jgi:ABC-2 type transport system ATP-binding protein
MKEVALKVNRLSKKYGKVEAVKDVTFSIAPKIISAFLGENGAGKTTTLKLILGFLKRDSGEIELPAERIGYVPEHPLFFPWLRGKEILAYTLMLYGIAEEKQNALIQNYSEKIGFEAELLSRKVQTYSLGNQKKFSYLQSLIISPEFLIVDEPFSSLDPLSIKKVRELFLELKDSGRTLFLSSHIISEIEKICDDFIIIKKGRIVFQANLPRAKEDLFLIQVDKECVDKRKIAALTPFLKETDSSFEFLLDKSYLQPFEEILREQERPFRRREVNLEKIFLFFT